MSNFKIELNQRVVLALSEESGVVVGRAEFTAHTRTYLVRYVRKDGSQNESWFDEDAIKAA